MKHHHTTAPVPRIAGHFIRGASAAFVRCAPVLSISAVFAVSAHSETVRIASAADWATFASRVNAGEVQLCAVMDSDVSLSPDAPRVGIGGGYYWSGEFNGGGHRLTVNWTFSGTECAAPFANAGGFSIHDLHVAGSITSDSPYVAGVVGFAKNGSSGKIERCRVSAAITCSFSGPAACGGFVGALDDSTSCKVEIRNCLFDGSLLGPSASGCGGFVGAKPYRSYLYLYDDLFSPRAITVSEAGSATFSRGLSSTYIIDGSSNCFYTRSLGTAQCNDGTSMTSDELVASLGSCWTVSEGLAMLAQFAVQASPPEPAAAGFVYQGALRDAHGGALSQKAYEVEFRVYAAATGGRALWARSCAVQLDNNGLFNVALHDAAGDEIANEPGTGLPGVLADYSGTSLFIGLTVVGSSAEIAPRQKLVSVPYATYAADLFSAKGGFTAAGALTAGTAKVAGLADVARLRTEADVEVGGNFAVGGTVVGYGTMPLGGIVIWSGYESAIPDGWALCNGRNQTPDLRSRFIVGAGSGGEYAVGATGGEKTHRLTVNEMPSHNHTYSFKGADLDLSWDNDNYFYDASEHYKNNNKLKEANYTGGDQPHENRPPYYALCYIMRVR